MSKEKERKSSLFIRENTLDKEVDKKNKRDVFFEWFILFSMKKSLSFSQDFL